METKETLDTMLKYVKSLRKELIVIKKSMISEQKLSYTNQEVMQLFGISTGTLKKWRDNGLLGYSLLGNTYMYSKQDITDFLQATHYEAYATNKKYREALQEL